MTHAFIDVEAFRLHQPWKAPLAQVSAIMFDDSGQFVPHWRFNSYIDQNSIPDCMEVDEETWNFWQEQEAWPKLRDGMANSGVPFPEALSGLISFLKDVDVVWFAGPQYDQVMLQAYFDVVEAPYPWKYNNVRDFRTIRKQYPDIEYVYPPGDMAHDSFWDCYYSIQHLNKISKRYGVIWR